MKLKKDESFQKLRGGYYTPRPLADFIVNWAIDNQSLTNTSIFEPSCGDGVFLNSLLQNVTTEFQCTALEIDEFEADLARANINDDEGINIITNDFYSYYEDRVEKDYYDVVIGNPPYIRYQYLTEKQRNEQSDILIRNNLKPNKLINSWVAFTIAAVQMLKVNGKIGFVIPAELLQVKYAEQLRTFLMNQLQNITIVTFRKLIFPNVEQEVILLLGEKIHGEVDHRIKILEFNDLNDLQINFKKNNESILFQKIDLDTSKWLRYFLGAEQNQEINRIKKDARFIPFTALGEVDIGITTGNNSFFSVDKTTVEEYDLQSVSRPLIARSVNIPGVTFNFDDWKNNVTKGAKTFLLDFNSVQASDLSEKQREYIELGEKNGDNLGYKCSIRKTWYKIPSIWVPDAFFLRRNYLFPKFVLNNAGAVSTDTMHRVKLNILSDPRKAIIAYYTSVGLAFTELEGRSYGGGVLEVLPGELEKIIIPNVELFQMSEFDITRLLNEIDRLMRLNDKDIEAILDTVDKALLIDFMGMSQNEVKVYRDIWKKLRDRRLGRQATL